MNDRLHTALSSDGLAMDDSRFSTTGAVSKTFYVDENTQYLGVDATKDTADDIDTVYSVGGMKGSNAGNVIVIVDEDESRDALYVILVNADASVGSADILYAAGSSTDKVGTDKYVREFWSMEDNTSEDITIDEKLSANGFYEVDSIDEDGVYTLKDYDKTAHSIDEDSDGIVVEDLALDNTDQIYRNALSGTIDNVEFDDVSIANATIIDGRSRADRNDSVYDREINSISRLEAALDAVRDEDLETKGTVEIDLYVKDGEITFICVTDVGGAAKDDGEQNPEESKYEIAQTSSGTLEITVSGKTLALTNAKVYDSANTENVNYKEMDVSVLVERKSDSQGYVEETSVDGITVRSQGNDKDAQCKIGADNFKVTLPYALSDGDYRVTMTFTGDVVGTITYQDMVTVS